MQPLPTGAVSLLSILFLLATSSAASAHATLTYPTPRTLSNKLGPCGADGSVRGTEVAVFAPGETITVTWDETVDHPGHYRLAFDLDGDDDFPNPQFPDDAFPSILVDQIPDRSGGGVYSQQITFPNQACENCTLQLIQIMTTQVPYNSFYFQCADIALRGPVDSGSPDAGGTTGSTASGEGCSIATIDSSGGGLALFCLALLFGRRRRHTFWR